MKGIEDYPGAAGDRAGAGARGGPGRVRPGAGCDGWFWDLAEYCPNEVTLRDDSPAARLKQHLKVTALPVELEKDPSAITKLKLLDLPAAGRTGKERLGVDLGTEIGRDLDEETPSEEHLLNLIAWFADRQG